MGAPDEIRFTRRRRVDWRRIVFNLRRAGMGLRAIAETIQVPPSTLHGYLSEDLPSEPAYYTGHALLTLWCERCGCSLEDVPIREVQPSVSEMLKAMR